MKYCFDRKYISNKRFGQFLLLHWYVVCIAALIVAAVFAITDYSTQKKNADVFREEYPDGVDSVTYKLDAKGLAALTKYQSDQALCRQQKEYNKTSVYMQLDPENVHYLALRYVLTTDEEEYWYDEDVAEILGIWKQDEAIDYLVQETAKEGLNWTKQDFKDLVSFGGGGRIITVSIVAPDSDMTTPVKNAIDSYFNQKIMPVYKSKTDGKLTLECRQAYAYSQLEKGVRDMQEANINRVSNYENGLATQWETMDEEVKKYYTQWKKQEGVALGEEIVQTTPVEVPAVSKKAALKKGALGLLPGVLAGLLIALCWFYIVPVIYSGSNIEDSFHMPVIGDAALKKEYQLHQHAKGLWESTNRRLVNKGTILGQKELEFLIGTFFDTHTSVVMLTKSLQEASEFRQDWEKQFAKGEDKKFAILSYEEVISDEKKAALLKEADGILLAEKSGAMTMKAFAKNLKLIAGLQGKILGALVVS